MRSLQKYNNRSYTNKMIDTITMKDGRKVSVDFADVKSVLAVRKTDWPEIREYLQECIDFVKSPKYMENLRNSFSFGASTRWSNDGSCLTIHRW